MFPLPRKTILSALAVVAVIVTAVSMLHHSGASPQQQAQASVQPAMGADGSKMLIDLPPLVGPSATPAASTSKSPTLEPDSIAVAPPPPPAAPVAPVNKFAVIVGITYPNTNLGVVRFANQDAGEIYSVLINQMGFPKQNVILLQDQNATRENIINSLDWLHNNPAIDGNSEVVFFYSGHGLKNGVVAQVPTIGDDSAIVPYDFANFDYKNGAGIIWDYEVAARLQNLHPARMWVSIDSCFSGGFLKPGIIGPNRVVTASSQGDELSNEINWVQRGVFTRFMVDEALSTLGMPVQQAFWYAYPRSQNFRQSPQISDNYPGSLDLR